MPGLDGAVDRGSETTEILVEAALLQRLDFGGLHRRMLDERVETAPLLAEELWIVPHVGVEEPLPHDPLEEGGARSRPIDHELTQRRLER